MTIVIFSFFYTTPQNLSEGICLNTEVWPKLVDHYMPIYAPGNVPKIAIDIEKNAAQFKLEGKRERSYPRSLKASKNRYPVAKSKYAIHLK